MAYITVLVLALVLQFQGSFSADPCLENPPKLNKNYGKGAVLKIGGIKTYVSGNPHTRKAIILISDVYGYEAPKLRKIGDKVADAGYYALVPDFLFGDPGRPDDPNFNRTAWLEIHGYEKGFTDGTHLISTLIKKGFSSIGVSGFCWGGLVAAKLASSDKLKAVVSIHPSQVTLDDINKVRVPLAFLGAEFDGISSPKVLNEFGRILTRQSKANFVKIYPGVSHGFSIRYDENNATAVKIAEESHTDMLNWLLKYVMKDGNFVSAVILCRKFVCCTQ